MSTRFVASSRLERTNAGSAYITPILQNTMMAWVRVTEDKGTNSQHFFWCHGEEFSGQDWKNGICAQRDAGADLTLRFFIRQVEQNTGVVIALNRWYHVAWTVGAASANQFICYLNGVAANTTSGSPNSGMFAERIFLGNANDPTVSATDYLGGEIEDFMVFDRVLLEKEIQAQMMEPEPIYLKNLDWWVPCRPGYRIGEDIGRRHLDFASEGSPVVGSRAMRHSYSGKRISRLRTRLIQEAIQAARLPGVQEPILSDIVLPPPVTFDGWNCETDLPPRGPMEVVPYY